jgi:hypothetical protein
VSVDRSPARLIQHQLADLAGHVGVFGEGVGVVEVAEHRFSGGSNVLS